MGQLGISAQGTLLYRQSLGVGSFVEIKEIGDIMPPAISRKEIDTTTHNLDDETFVLGIKRNASATFPINYVPSDATHNGVTGLLAALTSKQRDVYKLIYPDGTIWLFSGFVSNFAVKAPVDDKLTADVTIRPTGTISFS